MARRKPTFNYIQKYLLPPTCGFIHKTEKCTMLHELQAVAVLLCVAGLWDVLLLR